MQTTEQWLYDKISAYNQNPKEALEDMLTTTTDVIEQFLNNQGSRAAIGVLQECMGHNKLFIEIVKKQYGTKIN